MLDFSNVDRILLELSKNTSHSIFEPESFPFELDTLDECFVVFDRMSDLPTRFCSFAIYGIDHVVGTFVAESHRIVKLNGGA